MLGPACSRTGKEDSRVVAVAFRLNSLDGRPQSVRASLELQTKAIPCVLISQLGILSIPVFTLPRRAALLDLEHDRQ